MSARRLIVMAVLLAIGAVVGRTAGWAAPGDAKETRNSGQLARQCAEAQLKLAEMNLARMKELNDRIPGTLITGMVQQFEEEVELAKAEVKIHENNPGGDPYQACVERMRLALKSAEARAQRALNTYEKAPNIVSKADVERMRQVAIVADLELQRGLSLADAPPETKLQWELDVYGSEIDRVRIYTYLLGQNRFGEFSPGL